LQCDAAANTKNDDIEGAVASTTGVLLSTAAFLASSAPCGGTTSILAFVSSR
jgi:hypothetical protein